MNDILAELKRRLPTLAIDRDAAALAPFSNDTGTQRPIAVLAPRDAAELRDLVVVARTIGMRLVPVSSRGEHHRGAVCADGTAVVDLRRFDNLVRVDRRNRVFITEAAVDFAALQPALAAHGLRAMLPLAPRPGKSVLAAYLDREPTIYPRFQWDLADPLLCLEVVFGTGELFRTGSAAGPGTLEEQWRAGDAQNKPMRQGHNDLMRLDQRAHATIGIATWCSAKCEPLPARETLHLVGSDRLTPLLRLAYGLLRRSHADILLMLDGCALSALLARERAELDHGQARALPWNLVFSVSDPHWFPEEKLAWVWREIRALQADLGLSEQPAPPLGTMDDLHRRLTRPDLDGERPSWRNAHLAGARELGFHTTLDRVERFVDAADRVCARARWPHQRVLRYVQPQLGGRVCHVELTLPHAAEDSARAADLFLELAKAMKTEGAFFSRPYGPVVDLALAGTSAGALLGRVKRLFDPDAILAPGRLQPSSRQSHPGGLDAVQ